MRIFTNPDAWEQVGRELGSIWRNHPWIVADWWVDGDELPRGVRMAIVQAPDWTGPPYETCKQFGRIARRWPPGCRYLHLDIWHHQEVAMLTDELARPLLEQAEREHWIVNRLRRERHLRVRAPLVGGDVFDDLGKLILALRKYRGLLLDVPWPIAATDGHAGGSDAHYSAMRGWISSGCPSPKSLWTVGSSSRGAQPRYWRTPSGSCGYGGFPTRRT